MIARRRDSATYNGKVFPIVQSEITLSKMRGYELETICKGLELLRDTNDKYRITATDILDALDGIRQPGNRRKDKEGADA